MFVCSLITWELEGLLSPNCQGSSRAPQGWFKMQKFSGVMGRAPEHWHFSYLAATAVHTPLQAGLGTVGACTGADVCWQAEPARCWS